MYIQFSDSRTSTGGFYQTCTYIYTCTCIHICFVSIQYLLSCSHNEIVPPFNDNLSFLTYLHVHAIQFFLLNSHHDGSSFSFFLFLYFFKRVMILHSVYVCAVFTSISLNFLTFLRNCSFVLYYTRTF